MAAPTRPLLGLLLLVCATVLPVSADESAAFVVVANGELPVTM